VKTKISKNKNFLALLHRCQNWSLTLEEEHRLRVFKSSVLQNISKAKTEKEYEGWRKLHNEQLPCLQYLPNITTEIKSLRIIRAGHVACMAEKKNA
jgi:hypothetical protein